MANNGDVLAGNISAQIDAAGGNLIATDPDVDGELDGRFHLSDEDIDWIESAANDESNG